MMMTMMTKAIGQKGLPQRASQVILKLVVARHAGGGATTAVCKSSSSSSSTRCCFSSANPHYHDVVHQSWQDAHTVDPVFALDYWKASPNDDHHFSTMTSSPSSLSESPSSSPSQADDLLVDYWKDHEDSHFVTDVDTGNQRRRSFSTKTQKGGSSSTAKHQCTSPSTCCGDCKSSSSGSGKIHDYWTEHNDTHFTDYWSESGKTHF